MSAWLGSTAEVCAAFRTLGGVDPHAHRFLRGARITSLARVRLLHPLLRSTARRLVRGAFDYELARTRHLDGVVAEELSCGATQLVLLGAGFDSRGHRFDVRTFELDLPAMSARKQRLARGLRGDVVYAPVDLERDDPGPRLAAAGFDVAARTLVLWIGVSLYVSPAAVDRALAFAAGLAPGSALVFDYVFAPPPAGFTRAVGRRGEPVLFGTSDVSDLCERHGLALERDVRPAELPGETYDFIAIAHARVPGR